MISSSWIPIPGNFKSKLASLLLASFLCFAALGTAQADSPLLVTHDKSFGAVTVGAVELQLDTIRWAGTWSPAFIDLSGADPAFGFSGDSIYNDFTFNYPSNTWRQSSLITAIMKNPATGGASPAMGFWFSPDREGEILTKQYTYTWPSQSNPNLLDSEQFTLSGVGVADDPVNPKITLEVTTDADEDGDKNINMPYGGTINFQVTARSTDSSIKHVMVVLNASEKNGCINEQVSFQEKAASANEFPDDGNGYFHYIVGYDPDGRHTEYCIRQHSFIVSVDKPFTVEVKNLRPNRDGAYAMYDFFARGHYDATNPDLWPGSHVSYILTANNSGVPVEPDADGDGINDSVDNCPYYNDPSNLCFDPDGDKVYGTDDNCPDYYDPSNVCSDRDNDNIHDNDDKCPDVYDPSNACAGETEFSPLFPGDSMYDIVNRLEVAHSRMLEGDNAFHLMFTLDYEYAYSTPVNLYMRWTLPNGQERFVKPWDGTTPIWDWGLEWENSPRSMGTVPLSKGLFVDFQVYGNLFAPVSLDALRGIGGPGIYRFEVIITHAETVSEEEYSIPIYMEVK